MPVYGSNDGAFVLPLNNCDFTDYRPLLQLGWYITKGESSSSNLVHGMRIYFGYAVNLPSPLRAQRLREGRRELKLPALLGEGLGGEGESHSPTAAVYLLR